MKEESSTSRPRKFKPADHHHSPHDDKIRRKMIIAFFSGLLALVVVEFGLIRFSTSMGIAVFSLGFWNTLIGLPLICFGCAWIIWSVAVQYSLGKGTPAPMVATQTLVTSGPYRFSRNPMTLGALGLYLGLAIWNGSWAVMGLVLLIFSALLSYIYVFETRELSNRFGEEYLEYKSKTPFLVPKIG